MLTSQLGGKNKYDGSLPFGTPRLLKDNTGFLHVINISSQIVRYCQKILANNTIIMNIKKRQIWKICSCNFWVAVYLKEKRKQYNLLCLIFY